MLASYNANRGKLTSRRAPRRQHRAEERTGRQQGPGSVVPGTVSIQVPPQRKKKSGCTYSVGLDANLASGLVLDKPGPAASLDTSQSSVELLLEGVEAAVGLVDGLAQLARRRLTTAGALGGQVLPEEAVIEVTTTVEVDQGLQGDLSSNVTLVLGLLELLDGGVVAVDIVVVVRLVVQLHDLTGDGRLQSTVVI